MYRLMVILLTATLFATAAEAAKMYQWVDENGNPRPSPAAGFDHFDDHG